MEKRYGKNRTHFSYQTECSRMEQMERTTFRCNKGTLIASFQGHIIEPAEYKAKELEKLKNNR
ncbi:hypothetical protein KDH_26540 [Dictyobacter sp. S3.2.2.5]|uniref:Uncharacterized protein n=1 Tax=Dictyobacter halimunensis TaxID=3026934 RepID=A0ABQ6FR79_9CHLR|nr:hypothetical protein KDH_26540 [Dictyobacter sp. S3.2.2.5]